MYIAIAILAIAILVYSLRATGDESIGFGGVFEINDGVADAFVVVPKVESLGVPNEVTGTVESKRLDLDEAVIVKLATIHNGGSFQVKIQLTAATIARLETIRQARATKHFRVSIPNDTGFYRITVPGIITSNQTEDLEAEKITVINCSIEVSGKRVNANEQLASL